MTTNRQGQSEVRQTLVSLGLPTKIGHCRPQPREAQRQDQSRAPQGTENFSEAVDHPIEQSVWFPIAFISVELREIRDRLIKVEHDADHAKMSGPVLKGQIRN